MSSLNQAQFESVTSLEELYLLLDQVKMKNGWAKPTPSLYPLPKAHFLPAHWSYTHAKAALHVAGRYVSTDLAERRNLIMANPIPGNDYPTVASIVGAYQMVKGGEVAKSHRHTPNAMRLVLDSNDSTYTIVDGKKIPMLPGDVLLTPNWSYHGHSNESREEAYWIDFLDVPLVHVLGPMFFEIHPDGVEKTDVVDPNSPMRFAYTDYCLKLNASSEIDKGVKSIELGPPYLKTFDRHVISISAGSIWKKTKNTVNKIFTVIEGEGQMKVNEETFHWKRGDMLAMPNWNAFEHIAHSDSLLLQVSDEPLMKFLDWLR
jgi:gentisate 1,2-dioxygenase